MDLIIKFIITLVALAIPFVMYIQANGKRSYKWPSIVYLLLASPVLVSVVNDYMRQYEDANIGLGLAFMFTWLVTGIAFLVSLYVVVRKKIAV